VYIQLQPALEDDGLLPAWAVLPEDAAGDRSSKAVRYAPPADLSVTYSYSRPQVAGYLLLLCFLASAPFLYKSMVRTDRVRRVRRGLCPNCGYDLRGDHERCPECGTEVTLKTEPGAAS
jgi:hypothetical protein